MTLRHLLISCLATATTALAADSLGRFSVVSDTVLFTPTKGAVVQTPVGGTGMPVAVRGTPLRVAAKRSDEGRLTVDVLGDAAAATEFNFLDYVVQLMPGGILHTSVGGADAEMVATVERGFVASSASEWKSSSKGDDRAIVPVDADTGEKALSGALTVADVKKAGAAPRTLTEREQKEADLKAAPVQPLKFRDAPLSQVLMTMAEAAKISYMKESLPADSAESRINANVKIAPFSFLELVAAEHGIMLDYEHGIWIFRNFAEEGLIGRTYHLNYDNLEGSPKSSGGGGGGAALATGSTGHSGAVGSSLGASSKMNFDNDKDPPIVKELASLLELTSQGIVVSGDSNPSTATDKDLTVPGANAKKATTTPGRETPKGLVKWIPPHTVYVVASRQTHAWVRGYLSAVDRPQRIIAFEVKFIETSRNPTEQLGLAAPTTASATFSLTQGYQVLGHTAASASGSGTGSATTGGPMGVLMNTSDLAFTINALQSDSRTENVSFMQEATIENRAVELKNSVKVPVLDSSTTASSGATASQQGGLQTTAVTEKEVGTFVQLRPQIIDGNAVKVDIAVTVTDIIGTVALNGNDYPETAERSYSAPVIVRDGSSIAIAGLEKTSITRSFQKIPGFGDLPLLGHAFRTTNDVRKKQVLYIFITPHILSGYSGGIESVARGGGLGRPFALRYVQGLAQTVDDVRYNSEGIGRQVDEFYTKFEAGTLSAADKAAISDLATDVTALSEDLAQINRERFSPEGRQMADQLTEAQRRLNYLRRYFQIAGN